MPSALPALHDNMGCPDPLGTDLRPEKYNPDARSRNWTPVCCKAPCPQRGLPLPSPGGCGAAGAALRRWVPAAPQGPGPAAGTGLRLLPAPAEASPSLKDGTAGGDHVVLPFWEITRFLGTHGSPPERGPKPLALAPHPSQGRRWAVRARAHKASPPLQHQPSVVPQPPLPPKVGGRSVAGYNSAGFPPGLKRAG